MTTWLLRGLVFAAGMTLVRIVQGTLVNQAGTNSSLISMSLMALFTIPPFIWGLLDGRADAKASPDPDYRNDLAMRWLMAGLVAGAVSGIACWIISKFTVNMYAGNPFTEVTTIAAFTALLVFLPAIIACSIGRWMVDRVTPYEGRRRIEGYEGGNVFDAAKVLPEGYEEPTERVAVASRREESWRQEARASVEEVHESKRQRRHDLERRIDERE